MKSTVIAAALSFVALPFARAQLGESEEKCAAAFGRPIRTTGADASGVKTTGYRTAVFQITAGFKQGTASYLIYKKTDGSSMSDAEIESILSTNSPGDIHWKRKGITGERKPAVHSSSRLKSSLHDERRGPREWHVFGHDEFCAAYYFEKNVLLIWNARSGSDAASVLKENRL